MPGNPEFAHEKNVELSAKNAGDLIGYRDTAARKSEHDGVIPAKVLE